VRHVNATQEILGSIGEEKEFKEGSLIKIKNLGSRGSWGGAYKGGGERWVGKKRLRSW